MSFDCNYQTRPLVLENEMSMSTISISFSFISECFAILGVDIQTSFKMVISFLFLACQYKWIEIFLYFFSLYKKVL